MGCGARLSRGEPPAGVQGVEPDLVAMLNMHAGIHVNLRDLSMLLW